MDSAQPMDLINALISYPSETEWIEFKDSNEDPKGIGSDISALANSAAFAGKDYAYRIWGVDDETHDIIGTSFDYLKKKASGNQDLLIWLTHMLSQNASYEFDQFEYEGKHFVILKVRSASEQPVCFEKTPYIREGSSTMKLIPGSSKEAELWRRLQSGRFEYQTAAADLNPEDVDGLLDIETYFSLLGLRLPSSIEAAIPQLLEQDLLKSQDNGFVSITNLGALLLAKKLTAFQGLRKRVLRVIRFAGKGNFEIIDDKLFDEGYSTALQKAESYIMAVTPSEEITSGAFRKIKHAFPQRAVRELLTNTVIHQDMTVTSAGPLVGIYDNRLEFSNPGASLIPTDRILNAQPKTRNNGLVNMLRQMDLCEEGGTGWDLTVAACENEHMLAPKITSSDELGTKVTLYLGHAFERMTKRERLDALYWHACLLYAQGESMSNQTLRERFGLSDEQKNMLSMSRLIKEGCNSNLIKEEDEDASRKNKRYIPAWS